MGLDRRIAGIVFAGLWAVYALIGPGPSAVNPNSISRMGFVFAVLEDGSPRIDRFAPFTVDKAEFAGHIYLDKAPGLSLMALPVVAAARGVVLAMGLDPAAVRDGALSPFFWLSIFLVAALVVAPWTAAAAAAIYVFARGQQASRGAALFAALGFGLATPALGWATNFFSHGVTGAMLVLGFIAMCAASRTGREGGAGLAAVAGGLLAGAVVVEFTAAAPAGVIVLAGLWRLWRRERAAVLLGAAMMAGVAAVVPLALYNIWCFGDALHLGYSDVVGFEGMQSGVFGVTLPRGEVALALLMGAKRGLLLLSPLLVVTPCAWWAMARRWPASVVAPVVAVPLALLAINAGYAYWDGGASTGPRHLTPALAFLALALAPLWDGVGVAMRRGLVVLAVASFAICLGCAGVTMVAPMDVEAPLVDYIWPRLVGGEVHTPLMLIGITGFVPFLLPVLAVVWLLRRLGYQFSRRSTVLISSAGDWVQEPGRTSSRSPSRSINVSVPGTLVSGPTR